ncbi:MAG: helix-turn-helix domain-containing protein, partial [Flavobacteriales bacterium]
MEDTIYPCAGVQSVARMSHITDEQRCIIQRMKKAGRQQKQIAEAIGKSASAV